MGRRHKTIQDMTEAEWVQWLKDHRETPLPSLEEKVEEKVEEKPLPPEMLAAFCEYRVADVPAALVVRKQVTYFTTAQGLMEVRKLPFGVLTQKCEKPLIPIPLLTLTPGLSLEVPKLPWEDFKRIVAFFRQVSKEHKAEAIVQVFYRDGVFILHVPKQTVGGASVDHSSEFDKEGKMLHLMDIHSHVNMSGFFSSTDDADESKNVRIYGVVGKVDAQVPEVRFRMWSGKEFLSLDIAQVVEMPEESVVTAVPLTEFLRSGQTEVKAALSATFDPFRGAEVPSEWLAQVDAKGHRVGSSITVWDDKDWAGYGYGWNGQGRDWRDRFHSDLKVQADLRHGTLRRVRGTIEPAEADKAVAITTAKLHADKLVYLVHNRRVFRAEADGTLRLTALSLAGVESMKQRGHGKRPVIVLPSKSESYVVD